MPNAGGFQDSSVRLYCMDGRLQEASERRRKRPHGDAEGGGRALGPYAEGGAILRGHSRPVYGLDFSLDERLLLSASGDGTVRLWSTEIGANLVAYRWALCYASQQTQLWCKWPCMTTHTCAE